MTQLPDWARKGRSQWLHRGRERPSDAVVPAPGQESVWDYPRPPRVEQDTRRVEVRAGSELVARSDGSLRVLETASPPTFYLPPQSIDLDLLVAMTQRSRCEWKGEARYWALAAAPEQPVGWSYPVPFAEFSALRDHFAFYPGRLACSLDGEAVRAQGGGFYGGWITSELVGPFKGDPGSEGW